MKNACVTTTLIAMELRDDFWSNPNGVFKTIVMKLRKLCVVKCQNLRNQDLLHGHVMYYKFTTLQHIFFSLMSLHIITIFFQR